MAQVVGEFLVKLFGPSLEVLRFAGPLVTPELAGVPEYFLQFQPRSQSCGLLPSWFPALRRYFSSDGPSTSAGPRRTTHPPRSFCRGRLPSPPRSRRESVLAPLHCDVGFESETRWPGPCRRPSNARLAREFSSPCHRCRLQAPGLHLLATVGKHFL